MKAWAKKKSLVRGIRFLTELEPMEREMLGDSASTVGERLIGRARSAPKDELAEMTGLPSGHSDAPTDPALAALLPSFFRDGDEEVEGESGVSRQFNETDIIKAKLLNLRLVGDKLGPDGSVHVNLTEREVQPWLGAMADIRTFHNAELERFRAELGAESKEVAAAENYLEWLGYHQDSLLTALMGELDVPEE
ncbi:MAG TPA: DUF2017 domain-containing protein [Candidatus Corynebacterium avicola]|uniref:DUF2017 domain-containing protein n=1 Tax=Candidatus Corynebacterium avicola TaxID=2838527 RepID=A0A9D1UKV4_9CORY|nr:DUF2017 domain-containing protein [Candidatus Corynebacterium avicola]